jgi:hypothetical protein
MGVSGQNHAPATLYPRGKDLPVPTVQEAGWAPGPVWTQGLEEKSSASDGDRTPVVQSVVRYYWLSYPGFTVCLCRNKKSWPTLILLGTLKRPRILRRHSSYSLFSIIVTVTSFVRKFTFEADTTSLNSLQFGEIWGSHGNEYEVGCFLKCCTV